jgi:hypothetical protein
MLDASSTPKAQGSLRAVSGANDTGLLPDTAEKAAEIVEHAAHMSSDDAVLAGFGGAVPPAAVAVKPAAFAQVHSAAVEESSAQAGAAPDGPVAQDRAGSAGHNAAEAASFSAAITTEPDSQGFGAGAGHTSAARGLLGLDLGILLPSAQHLHDGAGGSHSLAAAQNAPSFQNAPAQLGNMPAQLAPDHSSGSAHVAAQPLRAAAGALGTGNGLAETAQIELAQSKTDLGRRDQISGNLGIYNAPLAHLGAQSAPPSPAQLSLQAAAQVADAIDEAVQRPSVRMAARAQEAEALQAGPPSTPVPFAATVAPATAVTTTGIMAGAIIGGALGFGAAQAEVGGFGVDGGTLAAADHTLPLGFAADGRSAGGFGAGAGQGAAFGQGFGAAAGSAAAMSAQILPLAQAGQAGAVEITLSPMELGQLRFEMRQMGDQVQIILSAERPETLELLRRHSDALLQDFRAAGFAGASLSFGGWGAGRAPSPPPQFSPDGDDTAHHTQGLAPSASQSVAAGQTAPWRSGQDTHSALNLRL